MGLETWATFVLAAAALSAFQRRDEIAATLNQHVEVPSQADQRKLFGAWCPCILTSVLIMLCLTQAHRLGAISRKTARKAIHISALPPPRLSSAMPVSWQSPKLCSCATPPLSASHRHLHACMMHRTAPVLMRSFGW